jgi:hypothetical protein
VRLRDSEGTRRVRVRRDACVCRSIRMPRQHHGARRDAVVDIATQSHSHRPSVLDSRQCWTASWRTSRRGRRLPAIKGSASRAAPLLASGISDTARASSRVAGSVIKVSVMSVQSGAAACCESGTSRRMRHRVPQPGLGGQRQRLHACRRLGAV